MRPPSKPSERGHNVHDGLIFDAGKSFGHLFLACRVAFPEDGYPVRLRGTSAMDIRNGIGAFEGQFFG